MIKTLLFSSLLLLGAPKSAQLCSGFLPENDLYISATDASIGGITKQEFDAVLDQIENHYGPIIAAKGGRLMVSRDWNNGTVNASANRFGSVYKINMYGGLARHPQVDKDAFMLVACHEIGHHIGGAPKITGGWMQSDWATNEGGADYFASLRCMRQMFNDADNGAFVQAGGIDSVLKEKCEQIYDTQSEENLCMRIGAAGFKAAMLFHELRKIPEPLSYSTPDQRVVNSTDDDHPMPQCRLDTYFQGGLCRHDMNVELSDTIITQGTCNESTGQRDGNRPRCWFKP